MGVQMLIEIN